MTGKRRWILLLCLAAAFLLLGTAAIVSDAQSARGRCFVDIKFAAIELYNQGQEIPVAMADAQGGATLHLFMTRDGKSWTIVQTAASRSCIQASGHHWLWSRGVTVLFAESA